ncbi:uncharacterized protein METZ01_LOCUS75758, partial [marine metagenome]
NQATTRRILLLMMTRLIKVSGLWFI